MKKLMRRLSRVGDSAHYSLLRSESRRTVPEGHVPVFVGEEMERFVVSAELLNRPIFVELLKQSAQEYGYEQKGVLRIPCAVLVFKRVLEALRLGGDQAGRDLQELHRQFSQDIL
ncbi:hypothetical protein Syun_009339 [Stephania yunnanensis]|uniref:Small auxin up regulated protein n=1 Tax=Stephania yunnanensis TaxID=152371 RepID=A0AAP0PQS6_9MAGN